jgi:sugar/nucleoside kinase (ribokinase family)
VTAPDLVVVGTLALDDLETPSGRRSEVLGGSAVYFSVAAAHFARVAVVGVVGGDFPTRHLEALDSRGIDLTGVRADREGRTFRWSGRYDASLEQATTLATHLNVLADFDPRLPEPLRRAPFVFLANTDPRVQASVLDQLQGPRLVVADTMNLWIREARAGLLAVLARVDGLVVNDAEARALAGESNLIAAGRALRRLGPRFAIVKKGEHGAFLFATDREFALPSYPLDRVVDPTGAGDTFAGGLMGRLAGSGGTTTEEIAGAMHEGTAAASFAVSGFGLEALLRADRGEIEDRASQLRRFAAP